MAENRSEELQEQHNRGQRDASNDDYDPPRPVQMDRFFHGNEYYEKEVENREAYDQGHQHTESQK